MRKLEGFANEYLFVLPDEILQQFDYSSIIKDLYVTDLGFYPKAKYHYVHRPLGANEWVMIFCTGGEGTIESSTKKWSISRGSIIIMPPNIEHTYFASEMHPWDIFWVHFSGKLVHEYLSLPTQTQNGFIYSKEDSEDDINYLMSLFWQMIQVLTSGFSFEAVFYDSQILGTLLAYVNMHSKLPGEKKNMGNEHLTKAIQYIYDNLDQRITLKKLTDHLGVSISYLSRIFKNNLDMGVNEFITSIKIKQASHYLQNTNLSVQQIAQGLGYSDPYYFSRAFKKIYKVSPVNYRNRYQSGTSYNVHV
ncbi:AraC family transcriptional regulator [Companilactobacillus alimentarius]|uniref:AraC family transcriptional regulator n=1 Tax=Companilactobacillus alimentarius DSM 20249 TaxID=1423720 RepID=A0A2K9HEW1_9LACO|nr:AraC family transcriptional regulator [Companilactobacillus alimentarius]AUI71090.1 AraC family transcriptional regulator [Companilactobacillus alimentarius DSM 20249]KRK75210.1 AraC family transcriptional regulator [Companilactobacillus alimentarius DSM 20249]MDT6951652.1 AraC family transcriptional regulator [Companilactobacillus alimentarius]GEO44011.1 transcriptional regulator [Companilactobacillus alimentarius]